MVKRKKTTVAPPRTPRFESPAVAAVFDAYPERVRERLMALRQLILDTAAATDGVGAITETLKWGQPSYLTAKTGSGSTIRIDAVKATPGRIAIYFHCQTGLVETFRELYRTRFRYEGNRAIVFDEADEIRVKELRHCISLALTYHLKKKQAPARA